VDDGRPGRQEPGRQEPGRQEPGRQEPAVRPSGSVLERRISVGATGRPESGIVDLADYVIKQPDGFVDPVVETTG
jgi:hypothetical protein